MKRFKNSAAVILFGLILTSAVSAQTEERPSKVNKIGNALVAYYVKTNVSRVMAPVRTVFDSSSGDFPLAKGAQKIDLILSYEFPGEKLTQLPTAIDFAFGSIAGLPARFDTEAKRQFKITIDGKVVLTGTARSTATVPTAWVTYEDLAVPVPADVNKQMLAASTSITIELGVRTFSLTRADLAALEDFNSALALLSR
ncbi:MAG: hypothetical protein AABN95_19325 [Acidobacteriota bacterium]